MQQNTVKLSKFLSLVLRHEPGTIGLVLDKNGWVAVDELLAALNTAGKEVDLPLLQHIVDTSDKKRFAFSSDGRLIRANQGHSVDIDLNLQPVPPPDILYHGTASRFLDSIREQGLLPRSRQHVHLSHDEATATQVGARHGKPVVITVDTATMHAEGRLFYQSDNGVWLTDAVPAVYLRFPDGN